MSAPVVTDPSSLGIVPERLDALLQRFTREIDAGLLPAAQLAVAKDGELAAFQTIGDADDDTRFVIFSATKVLVASAVWQLIGEEKLDPAKKVADYIPEFASHGKDIITVEQVMLHTSGFPHAPMGAPVWWNREGRLERMAEWRLNWEPGTAFEYHATSAHWVLAELVERLSGLPYLDYIEQRVTTPLGLPRILGIAKDEQDNIAEITHVGEPVDPDELEKLLGIRELPVTEVTNEALSGMNAPDVRTLGIPGGGGITTAANYALFYQALLHNQAGLWDETTLRMVTSDVRNHFPSPLMPVPANRALGVIVAGDDGMASMRGGFGKTVSSRTFGHDGAGGQIAWVDPDSGVSFCYFTNGNDANFIRQGRRGTALGSLAGLLTTPL